MTCKLHAVKINGGKQHRKPARKHAPNQRPITVKERQKRNPFEEKAKKTIAQEVIKPFEIITAQRIKLKGY